MPRNKVVHVQRHWRRFSLKCYHPLMWCSLSQVTCNCNIDVECNNAHLYASIQISHWIFRSYRTLADLRTHCLRTHFNAFLRICKYLWQNPSRPFARIWGELAAYFEYRDDIILSDTISDVQINFLFLISSTDDSTDDDPGTRQVSAAIGYSVNGSRSSKMTEMILYWSKPPSSYINVESYGEARN
jgi:hypothetical protein